MLILLALICLTHICYFVISSSLWPSLVDNSRELSVVFIITSKVSIFLFDRKWFCLFRIDLCFIKFVFCCRCASLLLPPKKTALKMEIASQMDYRLESVSECQTWAVMCQDCGTVLTKNHSTAVFSKTKLKV